MSKSTKIIAGAGVAALALAAIPAVASFAVDPTYTNNEVTYTATINETLSLASSTAAPSAEVLTNGGAVVSTATHTLTAITNHTSGYTVSASAAKGGAATSLTDAEESALANANDGIAYGTPAVGTSAWNLGLATSESDVTIANSGILGTASWDGTSTTAFEASTPTATTGDLVTVTMNASADSDQAAGTYTNTVTYTIAAKA